MKNRNRQTLLCFLLVFLPLAVLIPVFLGMEARKEEKGAGAARSSPFSWIRITTAPQADSAESTDGQTFMLTEGAERDLWMALLPSGAGRMDLRVTFSAFDAMILDGETRLRSGDPLPADAAGHTYRVSLEKKGIVFEEGKILFLEGSGTPSVYIETRSGGMKRIDADRSYTESAVYTVRTADGAVQSGGSCRIHGRGHSSWDMDKKSYSLNLEEAAGLLGMAPAGKWALVSNAMDDSMLRSWTAYQLAAAMGMEYTPECRFVDLYLNGSYNGVYLLAQRVNADGGSVGIRNLGRLNEQHNRGGSPTGTVKVVKEDGLDDMQYCTWRGQPEDISGGYLLECDGRYADKDSWFLTEWNNISVECPEQCTREEMEYISALVRDAESSLLESDMRRKSSGRRQWRECFDQRSWAAMYIMQEFMVQYDTENYSFFFYKKDGDDLLYAGPVWDFDLSMGRLWWADLPQTTQRCRWIRNARRAWLSMLMAKPGFKATADALYLDSFRPALLQLLKEDLPRQADAMASSVAMDRIRWGAEDPDAAVRKWQEDVSGIRSWMRGRDEFVCDYYQDPDSYSWVIFEYTDYNISCYVKTGRPLGFDPAAQTGEAASLEYGVTYAPIIGWEMPDGTPVTADTRIDRQEVILTPVRGSP